MEPGEQGRAYSGNLKRLVLFTLGVIPAVLLAQSDSIPMPGESFGAGVEDDASGLEFFSEGLSGYLEDTLNFEYLKASEETTQLNNLKLRLNTEGSYRDYFRYGVTMIGVANTGDREFSLLSYLPEIVENQIPVEFRDAYNYTLKDDQLYLQEAYGEWLWNALTFRFGRHKFYSGTGYAYNPIDLFNRKNPLDPTYETNGQDALMLTLRTGSGTDIEAVARTEDDYRSFDSQIRVKTFYEGWDLAAGLTRYGKKRIDWVEGGIEREFTWNMISAEFSGEIGGVAVYGEGGWVMIDSPDEVGSLNRAAKDHERLLIGVDYTFENQLYLMAEYLRFGQGISGPSEMDLNDRFAYLTGEVISPDKDTLFLGASYPVTDLMDFSLYGIINCNENSAILNPWLVWDVRTGWKLSLSITIPVGKDDGSLGRADMAGFIRLRYSF